jgi:endonuclease III-like uncharacterized protein
VAGTASRLDRIGKSNLFRAVQNLHVQLNYITHILIVLFAGIRKYLLSINGLGAKSVDCIRLLSLEHKAFPVSYIFFS